VSASHSNAFKDFQKAQREVNHFFWSSELSYALVRHKLRTDELRNDARLVHEIFKDIRPRPHAFIPPTPRTGSTRVRKAKYEADVEKFYVDLAANLEALCCYVIVRFHSALELFIIERCNPFLAWRQASLPEDEFRRKERAFKILSYEKLEDYLRKNMAAGSALRAPIPRKDALVAQAYRMLRNGFVHNWQVPWSDTKFRSQISNHSHWPRPDRHLVITSLCDDVANRCATRPDVPALFFYALFCLTRYRNLVSAVEKALPLTA
jgi:hypothetical protein